MMNSFSIQRTRQFSPVAKNCSSRPWGYFRQKTRRIYRCHL